MYLNIFFSLTGQVEWKLIYLKCLSCMWVCLEIPLEVPYLTDLKSTIKQGLSQISFADYLLTQLLRWALTDEFLALANKFFSRCHTHIMLRQRFFCYAVDCCMFFYSHFFNTLIRRKNSLKSIKQNAYIKFVFSYFA